MNYKLAKQFRIGFGAFARSSVFTSANNLVTLPGFVRFDASIAWRAEKHYEIAFNFKNLANSRYYETSNGDNGILPGSPINGSVTLRYRW
jgi:catecholate siderophore receptor